MALDGQPILIQAKWHSMPVGWGEIAPFLGPGTAVTAHACYVRDLPCYFGHS